MNTVFPMRLVSAARDVAKFNRYVEEGAHDFRGTGLDLLRADQAFRVAGAALFAVGCN